MAKITSVNGLVFDGDKFKNPSNGTAYLDGTKIRNRATGESFEVEDVDLTSRDAIYSRERAKDWMPMMEPRENEIYLLFNIYEGRGHLAFLVRGCNYKVEIGHVYEGEFIADESRSEILPSNNTYEKIFDAAEFSHKLSDGGKQIMIKISGEKLQGFELTAHSGFDQPDSICWDVVEIWGNAPELSTFVVSKSSVSSNKMPHMLEYIKLTGKSKLKNVTIYNMIALKMVLELALHENVSLRKFDYFCYMCPRLIYIPKFTVCNSMNYAFGKTRLKKVEIEGCENVSKASMAFFDNTNLTEIIGLDTRSMSDTVTMNNCVQIKHLEIDTSGMSNASFYASGLISLESIKFKTSTENAPRIINLTEAGLSTNAILEMFDSLPYVEVSKTVILTKCAGVDGLTDADIEEVTAKGWTVSL